MEETGFELKLDLLSKGYFELYRKLSQTDICIYTEIRNLDFEKRFKEIEYHKNQMEERQGGMDLSEQNFAENYGTKEYHEMFSSFVIEIGRNNEQGFLQFICESNEGDIFIKNVIPHDNKMIIHNPKFLDKDVKDFYQGVELTAIEENLSIALNEYLRVHSITENLIKINEHLASILLYTNIEGRIISEILNWVEEDLI